MGNLASLRLILKSGECYDRGIMDRKEMIREYKESLRPMGVFRVRNKVTGRSLIGTSVNLTGIINRHQSGLRMGGHENKQLQKDWNELGPDAFEFETLDVLDPPDDKDHNPTDDLRQLEQLWLEKLAPLDRY